MFPSKVPAHPPKPGISLRAAKRSRLFFVEQPNYPIYIIYLQLLTRFSLFFNILNCQKVFFLYWRKILYLIFLIFFIGLSHCLCMANTTCSLQHFLSSCFQNVIRLFQLFGISEQLILDLILLLQRYVLCVH